MMELISQIWQFLLGAIGSAHPVWLFLALALLPLVGVPTSPLWIAVGVRSGTVSGSALAVAALLVNYTMGYWLARCWLRQRLALWLKAWNRSLPLISKEDEGLVILLLRVTPGLPLFVQNYVLGMGQVDFGKYLIISILIQSPQAVAFVWFGNSLATNAVGRLLLAVAALIALSVLVVLIRRLLKRRVEVRSEVASASAKPTQLTSEVPRRACL